MNVRTSRVSNCWKAVPDHLIQSYGPSILGEISVLSLLRFNALLIAVFGKEMLGAEQTRGRPGYPNDNRLVEQ